MIQRNGNETRTVPMTAGMARTLMAVALRVIGIPRRLFRGIDLIYGTDSSVMKDTRSGVQKSSGG